MPKRLTQHDKTLIALAETYRSNPTNVDLAKTLGDEDRIRPDGTCPSVRAALRCLREDNLVSARRLTALGWNRYYELTGKPNTRRQAVKPCHACGPSVLIARQAKYCSQRCRDFYLEHGISLTEFNAIWKLQGEDCAICASGEDGDYFYTKRVIDAPRHCPYRDDIRGILCQTHRHRVLREDEFLMTHDRVRSIYDQYRRSDIVLEVLQ